MAELAFFLAGIGAIAGATGVVVLRNPLYSVLSLVSHLLCLALLFLLLRAEFVAAAQVVVYAGAVMVLYVFVVAYVGGSDEPLTLKGSGSGRSQRLIAGAFALALFVELSIAILGTGLQALDTDGAPFTPSPDGFGTPAEIGRLLLTDFLLPFEAASFLLLIAAVGAVTLARRRGGIGDPEEIAPARAALEYARPISTGTMAEGVGAQSGLAERNEAADVAAAEERKAQELHS